MTKKARLIILLCCAVVFLTLTPYIILYSLGYRVDIMHVKIVATGGIYIKALPVPATIAIDGKIQNVTSIFSPTFFVQNLLPQNHSILITEDGYYPYQKTLPVEENQVTKLEHVTLFKKNMLFSLITADASNFYPTPDGNNLLATIVDNSTIHFETINLVSHQENTLPFTLRANAIFTVTWSADSSRALIRDGNTYFLLNPFSAALQMTPLTYLSGTASAEFSPQDSTLIFYLKNDNLYSNKNIDPLVKNVVAFGATGQAMYIMSGDGFLYSYDSTNNITSKISSRALTIKKPDTYQLILAGTTIFLQENSPVFLFDQTTKAFEPFADSVTDITLSPDGQKYLFYNNRQIAYILKGMNNALEKVPLISSQGNIGNCQWLGSDYIVYTLNNTIIISEIDTRGNINTIPLPQNIMLDNGSTLAIKNPTIYFNQQDKKLYILTAGNLLNSEKLLP